MQMGIVGQPAPPLRHVRWIDGNGQERGPLSPDDIGDGYRILYFFQDWCAGCHAHGFPTLAIVSRGPTVEARAGLLWRVDALQP
jgi:hypothetical protein